MAYFSRESMAIVGNETLEISRVEDKRFPIIYDQIPVPSILDFQIDTLAIKLMHESLKRVIKRLKIVIFTEKRWYEAYLTIFVLLNTLMAVFKHQLSYQEQNANMVGVLLLPCLSVRSHGAWVSLLLTTFLRRRTPWSRSAILPEA
jgi:hypothetical protein